MTEDRLAGLAEFSRSLRGLREAAGRPRISQLAQLTGYHRASLYRALAGSNTPSRRLVEALTTALGADPELWAARYDALQIHQGKIGRPATAERRNADGVKLCDVDGCPSPGKRRWCNAHARRHRLYGDPTAGRFLPKMRPATCSVEGCDRPYRSLGLCKNHYDRHRRALAAACNAAAPKGY